MTELAASSSPSTSSAGAGTSADQSTAQPESSAFNTRRSARGIRRPSLAHLASQPHLHGSKPDQDEPVSSYDAWLRTLPASSASSKNVHADFSRPIGVAPTIQSHKLKKRPSQGSLEHWRGRSASVNSLNSVLSAQGMSRASLTKQKAKAKEPDDDLQSPVSASSEGDPVSSDTPEHAASWKSWFTFGGGEDKQTTSTSSHDQQRSLLSLFAGTGAVEEANEHASKVRLSEEAETQLLAAPLPVLSDVATYLSTNGTEKSEEPVEATSSSSAIPEQSTEHSTASGTGDQTDETKVEKKKPAFLSSSIFSSSSANPLQSPASMLSSLSLSLPSFGSSSSNNNGVLKTPARGYSQDHHPKRNVAEYLDEEDTAASKVEDDSHMERYTLIKERYKCPQHPLVFCHGLFGFDTLGPSVARIHYWIGVKEALESIGAEVLITKVPTSASIEERAKVLCETIEKEYAGREVNLIGHSMGGLDGRYLISSLQPTTFKVRSLTTITTPHQGSSFADYMLEEVIGNDNMPGLLRLVETLGIPGGGRAFDNLTTTKMARFNEETPNVEGVKYFSYGAEFKPSWSNVFRLPWSVIYEREGDNDGLVSVESAKHGEYQGTLTNVSHLDVIGFTGPIRFNWASLIGKPIKFKPVSFFLSMAEMLAENDL